MVDKGYVGFKTFMGRGIKRPLLSYEVQGLVSSHVYRGTQQSTLRLGRRNSRLRGAFGIARVSCGICCRIRAVTKSEGSEAPAHQQTKRKMTRETGILT